MSSSEILLKSSYVSMEVSESDFIFWMIRLHLISLRMRIFSKNCLLKRCCHNFWAA